MHVAFLHSQTDVIAFCIFAFLNRCDSLLAPLAETEESDAIMACAAGERHGDASDEVSAKNQVGAA